jgi:hypothetical protein
MKTNYTFQQKTLRFLSLFVGAITVTACGSYQNSSYYDNDGVYGPDKTVTYEQPTQNDNVVIVEDNNKYAQQFKNMQGDFEVFTDVDNYKSSPDTVYVQESNTRYAGWGENQNNNTTIIVNDNWGWNNWGWNGWYGNNWGWNNGWYGNGWGWNNGWYGNGWYGNGWGYNNWYGGFYGPYWGNGWNNGWYGNGWNNGWYGGGRNVAYNNGPRGGYVNRIDGNGNSGRSSSGRIGNPRSQTSQPRGNAIGNPRSQTSEPRTYNPRGNSNTGTPRSQTSEPRTYNPRGNSNTPSPRTISTPRNDSPRTISTPRSSDFGSGRGSGGSGGSSGGGRSGGGGGRGGRG